MVEFVSVGGEVAMGTITREQFSYWKTQGQSAFEEYMGKVAWDADEANADVPRNARITKPFYEFDDICHLSGPELSDGQYLILSEVDAEGERLTDDDGGELDDEETALSDLELMGTAVTCVATHNRASHSCKKHHFLFGQCLNQGTWTALEPIHTGPDGVEFRKMAIHYVDADGFKVIRSVLYDGKEHELEENSLTTSSCFYVRAGDSL